MENYLEIQKLNIFQRMRLNIWQRKDKINLQKYDKLPDYIKNDDLVVGKIISEFIKNRISENDLFHIPISKIVNNINNNNIKLHFLSSDAIIKVLKFDVSVFEKIRGDEKKEICSVMINDWDNHKELFSRICNRNNKLEIMVQQRDKEFEWLFIDLLAEEYPDEFIKILSQNINEFSMGNWSVAVEKNPDILSYMSKENQMKFLFLEIGDLRRPEYFQYASFEIQKEFVEKNIWKYMKYANTEIQRKKIEENRFNLRLASIDVINDYVKNNPENLRYVVAGSKVVDIVNQNIELFDKMNIFAKKYFVNYNIKNGNYDIISKILQKDIKNIKFCESYHFDDGICAYNDTLGAKLWNINDFSNKTDSEIKNIFLHSKNFDAYGNISGYNTLHSIGWGNAGTPIDYRNMECLKEYINLLNTKQVSELIKIDSNYILPYIQPKTWKYDSGEINKSIGNAKELFIELYGIDKLKNYEKYIEEIFSLQEKYEKDRFNVDFKNRSKEPVQELKLLFNPTIMNTEGIDLLYEEYFTRIKEGKDSRDEFYDIIEKSYGKEARNILESRPGLDIHEINSLEVFDNRIKSIFEGKTGLSYEAFVHNCLSYNIENFSGFLDIVKDEEKIKNFSTYYEIIATIMGDNVETMQKAITQFDYIEEILKSVKDVELTDKQEQNLLSLLCSDSNPCNITSIEELECYEERLFLEESLSDREFAFKLHFGEFIEEVFDLSDEELDKYKYTDSEKFMLEVAKSCLYDKDYNYLEIYKDTPSNPIAFYSAMERTRKYQMEIFNSKLLTKEKLDKIAEENEDKDNPNVYVTIEDDIKTYHIMVDKKTRKNSSEHY